MTYHSKTIKFSEFKRLCFCNSSELMHNVYVIGGIPHEWVGIGMIELDCEIDQDKHIEVVEDT